MQGGQGLVDHLLQSAFHAALKLDVVYIDDVDIVDVQTLQTLIDALLGPLGRIVPRVDPILAVAAHLGGEVILVAGDVLQCLA